MAFSNHQPDRGKNSNSSKPDLLGRFVEEIVQEFIVVFSMGIWGLAKSFFNWRIFVTVPLLASIGAFAYWVTNHAHHIRFIHDMDPVLFTYARLKWLYRFSYNTHFAVLFSIFVTPVVLSVGMVMRAIRTKFQRIFRQAGLSNGTGDTPKLIHEKRLDKYRKTYTFDANGIGLSEFVAKTERIEAHFKSKIESIKHGRNMGQVIITFTKLRLPERVTYGELSAQLDLPKESFYLGQTAEGPKVQSVAELPHMLIAGTTGSGKSVYFKQALLGLLESSPHLQMYLIDLKGVLEMIDFVAAPNVQVIKSMDHAVYLLKLIEKEMKDRFRYLEESHRKQIVPEEDRKDRLIVAVDEASVLYMVRSKHDPDYLASIEARQLADSISKLSRAAAIHLLLATQKLDKQVIPTSVSENISGRMAFRANSLQGSMVVLGCKDASELPEIPGRAIWNYGTQKIIVQAPYVDEKTIQGRCKTIAVAFKEGKRKLFNPMIGEAEKKREEEAKTPIYEDENN